MNGGRVLWTRIASGESMALVLLQNPTATTTTVTLHLGKLLPWLRLVLLFFPLATLTGSPSFLTWLTPCGAATTSPLAFPNPPLAPPDPQYPNWFVPSISLLLSYCKFCYSNLITSIDLYFSSLWFHSILLFYPLNLMFLFFFFVTFWRELEKYVFLSCVHGGKFYSAFWYGRRKICNFFK